MNIIYVRIIVEDTMNPYYDEAVNYVREIICEAFGKEERKDNSRCKLMLLEVGKYQHD